eukprot:15451472-Alexandrium_andersonii.AAC.1
MCVPSLRSPRNVRLVRASWLVRSRPAHSMRILRSSRASRVTRRLHHIHANAVRVCEFGGPGQGRRRGPTQQEPKCLGKPHSARTCTRMC